MIKNKDWTIHQLPPKKQCVKGIALDEGQSSVLLQLKSREI